MNKKDLEKYISDDLTTRDIANKCGCSQSTVKYWLEKYGLKTQHKQYNKGGYRKEIRDRVGKTGIAFNCKYCGETDPEKFMILTKDRVSYSRCKKCHNIYTIERFRKNKEKAVEYKGGKCQKCGYDKCMDALDFHHIDPSLKDPHFDRFKARNFEKTKRELDKCMLLCSNCHREVHSVIRESCLKDTGIISGGIAEMV